MGQSRSLQEKRFLITGASQGIGRALVVAAIQRGGKVIAVARSAALLEAIRAETRAGEDRLVLATGDITKPEDRLRFVQIAEEKFGGLDILVNNAGIGATGHFIDATPGTLEQIFETNLFGTTELIRAFLPTLKKGNIPAIVNIGSILGKRGYPGRPLYSASKFAVQGFSEALRPELLKHGIDVLIVNPGLTKTNFSDNMLERKARISMEHRRGMTPETVALRTMKALERGYNEINLTLAGVALYWVNRLFPWIVDRIAKRKVRRVFAEEIAARKERG